MNNALIKKYTGQDVDDDTLWRHSREAGRSPIARLLQDAVDELKRAEDDMREAARKIQDDLNRVTALLDAGPDDRAYAVEGPAYMNVNPVRLEAAISLRGARVRDVQKLTALYRAEA